MPPVFKTILASSDTDFLQARELFIEYAQQLNTDLSFQNFEEELNSISEVYSKPEGALLLVAAENRPVGCVGIRKYEGPIAELKRMYLREIYRGMGQGRMLLDKAIRISAELGYKYLRLDSLPFMTGAIRLYTSAGFKEIEAYCFNPISGTKFFELEL